MAIQYANAETIESHINHILNRNPKGEFSPVGDTSNRADQRYTDAVVTNARREASYAVFRAIGSNLSHPFWGTLSEKIEVNHGDKIPPSFGEIGVPEIQAARYPLIILPGTFSIEDGTPRVTGTYTEAYPGDFGNGDYEIRVKRANGSLVYEAFVVSQIGGTATFDGDINAELDGSGLYAALVHNDSSLNTPWASWDKGEEEDADVVDSYRDSSYARFRSPFGGYIPYHDETMSEGVNNPASGKYSTENGYLKFTGYKCRIPMIPMPETGGRFFNSVINFTITEESKDIVGDYSPTFTELDIGKRLIVHSLAGVEVFRGIILSISGDGNTATTDTEASVSYSTGLTVHTQDQYLPTSDLADNRVPLDLASTVMRLAIGLLIKEGDNLLRTTNVYSTRGELDLVEIRQGAASVRPLDITRAAQMSERFN